MSARSSSRLRDGDGTALSLPSDLRLFESSESGRWRIPRQHGSDGRPPADPHGCEKHALLVHQMVSASRVRGFVICDQSSDLISQRWCATCGVIVAMGGHFVSIVAHSWGGVGMVPVPIAIIAVQYSRKAEQTPSCQRDGPW